MLPTWIEGNKHKKNALIIICLLLLKLQVNVKEGATVVSLCVDCLGTLQTVVCRDQVLGFVIEMIILVEKFAHGH